MGKKFGVIDSKGRFHQGHDHTRFLSLELRSAQAQEVKQEGKEQWQNNQPLKIQRKTPPKCNQCILSYGIMHKFNMD